MDAHHVGAPQDRGGDCGSCALDPLVDRQIEQLADEGLAGRADEDGLAELAQLRKALQNDPALSTATRRNRLISCIKSI